VGGCPFKKTVEGTSFVEEMGGDGVTLIVNGELFL
jgi:hypothetical protein